MSIAELKPVVKLPTHLDLPSEDGTFVKNMREHPQSILITESILPVLRRRHPGERFAIGQDTGIYWRLTDPPLRGVKAADWFYVPDVPPTLDGEYRRSYVLWQEVIPPHIILEFSSDNGAEELDETPWTGKFWIYERVIRPALYAIFIVTTGELHVFHQVDNRFERMAPNASGRFPVPGLDVELGVWEGHYLNEVAPWLRWWDNLGNLLPIDAERAEAEAQRAEAETRRAEAEAQRAEAQAQRAEAQTQRAEAQTRRAEALAAKLRELGIDPDEVAGLA